MIRSLSNASLLSFLLISGGVLQLNACSSDSGSEPSGDGDGDNGDGDNGDGDNGDGDNGDGDGDNGDGDGDNGDGDGDNGDGDGTPSGVACDRDERLGSFSLTLAADYTTFRGAVSNGISPAGVPAVLGSSGTCELLGAQNFFCATPCASGTVCAGDDTCVPEAVKVSAGLVTVTGANAAISEQPNGITLDYNETFSDPYPGFDVGAPISLSAPGDVADGFTLVGEGVGLLTSTATTLNVTSGEPLALSWDTAGASENSKVQIHLTVNAHGGTAAWIQCSAEDNGSFDIPADILQQLVELGLSGFPRITIGRRTVDSAEVTGGCVDFSVSSDVMLDVTVDGLVSCNKPEDCPDGQSCNPSLFCE